MLYACRDSVLLAVSCLALACLLCSTELDGWGIPTWGSLVYVGIIVACVVLLARDHFTGSQHTKLNSRATRGSTDEPDDPLLSDDGVDQVCMCAWPLCSGVPGSGWCVARGSFCHR